MDILDKHGLGKNDSLITSADKKALIDGYNAIFQTIQSKLGYRLTYGDEVTIDYTSTPVALLSEGSGVTTGHVFNTTARPQILSNGWIIICTVIDSSTITAAVELYISKNNGAYFSRLCTLNTGILITGEIASNFAIQSKGTILYVLSSAETNVCFFKIDAATQEDNVVSGITLDTPQHVDNCSLAISENGELTGVWAAMTATYPSSYNIRSVKSVDDGVTWTKQDGSTGIDQLTTMNTTGYSCSAPYVIYNKLQVPVITYVYIISHEMAIKSFYFQNSVWVQGSNIIDGIDGTHWHQCMTLQKYGTHSGRIWICWDGTDTTDYSYVNVRVSYSDDNGSTWSTPQKLTSGNQFGQQYPSVTTDVNGQVYIIFSGHITSGGHQLIRCIKWDGNSWGDIINLTNQSNTDYQACVCCDNIYNYYAPIIAWRDWNNGKLLFYGKFNAPQVIEDINYSAITLKEIIEIILNQNRLLLYKKSISGTGTFSGSGVTDTIQLSFEPIAVVVTGYGGESKVTNFLANGTSQQNVYHSSSISGTMGYVSWTTIDAANKRVLIQGTNNGNDGYAVYSYTIIGI